MDDSFSSSDSDLDAWELENAKKLLQNAKDKKKTKVKKEPTASKNDKGRFSETPLSQSNTLKREKTELESIYLDLEDAEKTPATKKKRANSTSPANSNSNTTTVAPSPRSGQFNDTEVGYIISEIIAGKNDTEIGDNFLKTFSKTQRTKGGVKGKAEKLREQLITVLLKPTATEIESSGMFVSCFREFHVFFASCSLHI
jgi:hypothetical protein